MEKRGITIGSYDTAAQGWTMTGWSFPRPLWESNMISVPGRIDGPIDNSTGLTDGDPRYTSRTLTANFERSDGTRLSRKDAIDSMVNWLDGWRQNIILPDDNTHYVTGRVSVAENYNDPAHASVTVTAICDPWRYNDAETQIILMGEDVSQTAELVNAGRRAVVPLLEIAGDGSMNLVFGSASWVLSAGTYQLPDLFLPQGTHKLVYSGTGMSLTITYREGVL